MESMERTQYWLDLAQYDLDTAQAMLETKRYLYVGFMCHQTVEKAFKKFTRSWQSGKSAAHSFTVENSPPFPGVKKNWRNDSQAF